MVSYLKLLILTCLIASCDLSGNSKKEEELFKKIKKGMNITEVTRILGEPDYINSNSDSGHYYFYFTENKNGMRSEMPYVSFDSTGVVDYFGY